MQRVKIICLTPGSKAGGVPDTKWALLPTTQHGFGAGRAGGRGGGALIPVLPPAHWDLMFESTFSWSLGGTMGKNQVYCKYSFNGDTMAAKEKGWGLG